MLFNSLMPLVRGYLESSGFKILVQYNECLVADKLIFGQERDTWIVWSVPPEEDAIAYESTLRGSISRTVPNYPGARAYVVGRSRAGFSRDFLQTLSDLRIKFLTPIQFFDAAFKVEEAPKAASVIADLRSLDISDRRVPQPYQLHAISGEFADLFQTMVEELKADQKPTVRVIVGRAGIGKSFLFRTLFAHLYDDFLKTKARQGSMRRPVPLVPEHLKGIFALRTELLVDNFLRTDVASPVARETFEWLLVNGFTSWLLDGLDELYAGDPDFFDYLLDLVTRRDSKAQITICCRDSLLTTSYAFSSFQEMCAGSSILKIYDLCEWQRPSKRQFAWLRLEGKLPKPPEQDTERVCSFLQEIDHSPTLASLSGLPFYCELLLQQFQHGKLQEFGNDVAMLNHVIDEMVKREIDKGLLDLRLLEPNGLQDWLEQIAVNYVEGQRYAEINRDDAMEYGKLVLRDGVDAKAEKHILISLLQFPLFRAGAASGLITFTHDLIAEVLAARRYLQQLSKNPGDIGFRLSRIDLEDASILRFMASRLGPQEEIAVIQALRSGSLQDRSFAILLSLIMLARPERDLIKRVCADFEARDLTAVHFKKRDLSGVSFRRAELSHAMFADCDLHDALFEGTFFNHTRFEGENDLAGAQFGDRSRVLSVIAGRKLLEDATQVRDWVSKNTGQIQVDAEPCPTALQTMRIFGKFINPLGRPRRDDLRRDDLASGRRHPGAASPEECIDEAVKHGYLTGPDYRGRIRRAEGDRYAEMVRFVRDSSISDGLGRMIAQLCRVRGCLHQLRT
jgi:hypothetical protein